MLKERDRQLQEHLQEKDRQLQELLQEKDRQLQELLQEKDRQLKEKDRQLEEVVTRLRKMVKDQQSTMRQLQDMVKILTVKEEQLQKKERQLQEALRQLKEKERQRKEWWEQIARNVKKGEELASGAWGVVYRGKLELPVAIKELRIITPQSLALFQREKEAAFYSYHCNIVQFLGAREDQHLCPNIVMELMDGNLRNFIEHQNCQMQQQDIVSIALDVAKGLSYLHQHNPPILHRDLKTDNILMKRGTAKIGDLGSAKTQQDNMTQNCGTVIYAAPEALEGNIQTPKVSKHFNLLTLLFLFPYLLIILLFFLYS